jgi:S-sulfo-L-cysteine synthase (3-phospho-L-serine-dependent)
MTGRRSCVVLVECNGSYGRELALRAPRVGADAVVLTAFPERFTAVAEAGVEVKECDTRHVSEVLAAVQRLQASREVRGLGAGYEGALPVASAAARALGLPGPSPAAAEDTLCKPRARALSNEFVGNRVPFWLLYSLEDVTRVEPSAYPLVAKPAGSGGSIGVAVVHSADELAAHVKTWLHAPDERGRPLEGPLLAEQLVPGAEYSVELFDGVPLALTRKILGGRTGLVETGHVVVPWAEADESRYLDPYLAALTRRLGIDWGPAHIEVRIDEGTVRLIEINYRLAGDFIPNLVELGLGIDMYEATLRAMLGKEVDLVPRTKASAAVRFLVTGEEGVIEAVTGLDDARTTPGVARAELTASPGAAVRPADQSGDRLGYVIAVGDVPDAALRAAEAGLAALKVTTRPVPAGVGVS